MESSLEDAHRPDKVLPSSGFATLGYTYALYLSAEPERVIKENFSPEQVGRKQTMEGETELKVHADVQAEAGRTPKRKSQTWSYILSPRRRWCC